VPLGNLVAAKQQLQVQLRPGTLLQQDTVELILFRALIGLDWTQRMLKQPRGCLLEEQQQEKQLGLIGDKADAAKKRGVHMLCCFL
jgi:hypothetical protein